MRFYSKYNGKPLEILSSYVCNIKILALVWKNDYLVKLCDLGDYEEPIAEVWDI